MTGITRAGIRVAACLALGLALLLFLGNSQPDHVALAQEGVAAKPTFTISALPASFRTDGNSFGLLVDPTFHLTPNSQYFFRTPEGLEALKQLGVKTLVYMVDRNNWKALYNEFNAEPQSYPSVMSMQEVVSIADQIGAELIPMLNVTLLCKRANASLPYTTENVKCKHAKAKDSVAMVKALTTATQQAGVRFERVIMGVEPYAGCAYWTHPNGVNCVMGNPPGRHQIRLPAYEYALRINEWADAIHQQYPGIQVGAHLHPTSPCSSNCTVDWNEMILTYAGDNIDFALVHQYFRIRETLVADEPLAQKLSYFTNQTDVNLRKVGKSGMPKAMRGDVVRWAPSDKKEMPIWYAEFNAAYADNIVGEDAAQIRRALYSGLSVGEMYLNLLKPTKVAKQKYAGGSRGFLHHLFAETTFIGAYQGPTMIFTPAWQMLTALKPFSNKEWLGVKAKGVPKALHGDPVIQAYSARSGKKLAVAFFNHSIDEAQTINVEFDGMQVKKAKVTVVGSDATSLLDQNNILNPNLVSPESSKLPASQVKGKKLKNIVLPPHSLTVIEVKMK